ncbi:MAG TPA: MarR family transcriptional regulator [Demequina sp.]|nr:MarR family transcriptional regulator [Demequina sp.]
MGKTAVKEARWLSLEDQAIWRQYLRATLEVRESLERDLLLEFGLSLNEYEVMVVLSESPDHTTRMSTLAEDLVNSRSRLTHTVHRMEKRGLVERTSCSDDRRGVNCRLTDSGYAVLESTAPSHVESVRRNIFDRLSREEIDALGRIMAKLGDV